MILQSLQEIKALLEIPYGQTAEDKKLLMFADIASQWMEEILNRSFMLKTRTEYYRSPGTPKLLLRYRPVYPSPSSPYSAISIAYDEFGYFGQGVNAFADTTLIQYTYGVDYVLQMDGNNPLASRSGIVYRINELWNKPTYRQVGLVTPFVWDDPGSLKVTYTAGFTVDDLPGPLRMACLLMIARMRYLLPLAMEVAAETYEERSLSLIAENRSYIVTPSIKSMIASYRNWKFASA